jgi:hypothetical protein
MYCWLLNNIYATCECICGLIYQLHMRIHILFFLNIWTNYLFLKNFNINSEKYKILILFWFW